MTDIAYPATIRPWVDDLIDRRGYDPRSDYVERYWLPVIGPTATWIVRRMAVHFDDAPRGFTVDLAHMAATMGLSYRHGVSSPFAKALQRLVMFGIAQPTVDGFLLRRKLPTIAGRHLRRLPDDMQTDHPTWAQQNAA